MTDKTKQEVEEIDLNDTQQTNQLYIGVPTKSLVPITFYDTTDNYQAFDTNLDYHP